MAFASFAVAENAFAAGASCFKATEHGKIVHFEYNEARDEVWTAVWDNLGQAG